MNDNENCLLVLLDAEVDTASGDANGVTALTKTAAKEKKQLCLLL